MSDAGSPAPPAGELILVPGHAVYRGGGGAADPLADESWSLLPLQAGEPPLYRDHLAAALTRAAARPAATVVLSGGATRADAAPRSEAEGYRDLADRLGWLGHPEVAARTLLEAHARDSLENLLFSLCRFRAAAGRWPERLTVVGWAFKAARFARHRDAIGWPATAWEYAAVNDPPAIDAARDGEARTVAAFAADPYAGHGELAAKRRRRDGDGRGHPYAAACPLLAALLAHRGPEPFAGPLPWRPAPD